MKHNFYHYPVMLNTALGYLNLKNEGRYLDCTFGAGGYTRAILDANSTVCVTAVDRDPYVRRFAEEIQSQSEGRCVFIQSNFAQIKKVLFSGQTFDGVVIDLGLSSMQIDMPERGFSFTHDGPLDMRMGLSAMKASDFINYATEEEIANVIFKYGEEVQSRQIAKSIINERKNISIKTTLQLAKIVRDAMHYKPSRIDPATKTFQAIRIHINDELGSIRTLLYSLQKLLAPGGRVVILSFHSLEDAMVKKFFKKVSLVKVAQSKYSQKSISNAYNGDGTWLRIITKKPLTPSKHEIIFNPRSRSARLRVAEKI